MKFIKIFIGNIKYLYQNGSAGQQVFLTIVLLLALLAVLSLFVIHPIWLYLLITNSNY